MPRYLRTLGYKLNFKDCVNLVGSHLHGNTIPEIASCEVYLLEDLAEKHIEAAQALLCLLRMQRATVRCVRDEKLKNTFASNIAQIFPKIVIFALMPAEILQNASPELLALGYNLSIDDSREVYKLRRAVQRDLACLTSIFRRLPSPFHANSQKLDWSAHPTAETFGSITFKLDWKVQSYLTQATRVKVTADMQIRNIEIMWDHYSDMYPGLTEQSCFDYRVEKMRYHPPEQD
ncbi:MAG: hypothetical protein Q9184_002336 [Pyrenodesmia sp. 2 TL-2023]